MDSAGRVNELIKKKTLLEQQKPTVKVTEVVEKLTEKVCFSIPMGIPDYEILAVVSAVKSYIADAQLKAAAWSSMRKNYRRELTLYATVLCRDEYQASIFKHCIPECSVARFYHGISADSFDMYHELDLAFVKSYKDLKKLHAAQVYGILFGCEAKSLFYIPVATQAQPIDILVENVLLWELLGRAFPNLKVVRLIANEQSNFLELVSLLHATALVVSELSLATYVACCLKKKVVEIYPTTINRAWLSKWSNPMYKMINKDLLNTPEDLAMVVKSVGDLWKMKYKQEAVEA